MVAIKGVLVATFFVVGRVIAVPLPGSELSVVVSEAHGINDIAVESGDLRSVTRATIEARKDKPKYTTPTKKPAKEPAKKPGKPKTCPPKRPRDLERRYMEPGKDPQKINEHQFVISKASATVWNLSGCTAVFFWSQSKIPSAFHILCGPDEKADAKKAADVALNADADSYFVIVAREDSNRENVLAGIEETFAKANIPIKNEGETREDGDGSIVQLKPIRYGKKTGQRPKFTATKGSTELVLGWDDISNCSVQTQ
jgi:hypothetical protein